MIITRTPFRISFFGGGTDLPAWFERYGKGAILSTTIDKYCYITCRYFPPFFDVKHRIVWSKIELVSHEDEIQHRAVRETLKFLNLSEGVEIHHHGDLPARSGLGSSSAFTVGLLNALYTLLGKKVSKQQLALDAIHVEQVRAKENVGCQDQAAAAFGGMNKIVFGGHEKIAVAPLALPQAKLGALEDRLMLFFTVLARDATEVEGDKIKNFDRKVDELRRMAGLVDEAIRILEGRDETLDDFGKLLHETWQLKRGLASVVSTPEIDGVYKAARSAGALGGKLLGAGGGGFMLLYVNDGFRERVREKLKHLLHVPFKFERQGSQVIYEMRNDQIIQETA